MAQMGPYPGGQYPGGTPGGGPGIPIPWPRRGKKTTDTNKETVVRTSGKLRRIDQKLITVDADDERTLEYQRTAKTKFYKASEEIEAASLKPGDGVSVESTQDNDGRLIASAVYFEKEAARSEEPIPELGTSGALAAPPAPLDKDDPGPPSLRRGAAG